jgi:hypothetical protein
VASTAERRLWLEPGQVILLSLLRTIDLC